MSPTKSDENQNPELLYVWIPLYIVLHVLLLVPSAEIYDKSKNGYITMLPMVPATPVFLTAVGVVSVLSFLEHYTLVHLIFDCILAYNIETTWLSETGILCCILCHWGHGASPATTVVVHFLLAPILHRESVPEAENRNTNDASYGAITRARSSEEHVFTNQADLQNESDQNSLQRFKRATTETPEETWTNSLRVLPSTPASDLSLQSSPNGGYPSSFPPSSSPPSSFRPSSTPTSDEIDGNFTTQKA